MPRGPRGYSDICPEQCSDGSTPYSDFEAAIQVFNEVLVAKLRGLADVEVGPTHRKYAPAVVVTCERTI
eukprot:scaffold1549_cov350-Prasinococcus_capsulatus_cf.AAC.7